jgi:colanic acid biosynthesis glycosyl transferase WcaI
MLHQHYYPEMAGTARRTKELAEELVKNGYEVAVITTYPREYRSIPGEEVKRYQKINGVDILRVQNPFQVKHNVLERIISYAFFILLATGTIYKNRKKYDMMISLAPIAAGIIGAVVNKLSSRYHHFDVPDILPDLGIAAGMIKNRYLIKILYGVEKIVYNNSNTISAITQGQIKNIKNKGVPTNKLSLIPDWIDSSYFKKYAAEYKNTTVTKRNKDFNDKYVLAFIGNIGSLQNPLTFIKMMELINADRDDIVLKFIGDGIERENLEHYVHSNNVKNIDFAGRMRRELIPAQMAATDILLANYLDNEYMNICIPGKTYEYAISRVPVVIGAFGEAKNFIEHYGVGLAVTPSHPQEFKDAVYSILDNGRIKIEEKKILEFENKYNLHTISLLYNEITNEVEKQYA